MENAVVVIAITGHHVLNAVQWVHKAAQVHADQWDAQAHAVNAVHKDRKVAPVATEITVVMDETEITVARQTYANLQIN